MITSERYENQLRAMAGIVQKWKAEKKPAVIQFNFPPGVCLVATISDALENHFVTADEGGIELLKLLGMGQRIEPTVLMVRAVIE